MPARAFSLLSCSFAALVCTAFAEPAPPPPLPQGTTLIENQPYVAGGTPHQVLDLYLPSGDALKPVILYLHGGGLTGGTKKWAIKEAVLNLIPEGYAVVAPDYRFVTEVPFPAQIEDCIAAYQWIKANAAKYRLDPDRIGVWGYSAGALLAGLLATASNEQTFVPEKGGAPEVDAVLIWSGRCDLTRTETMSEKEKKIVDGYLRGKVEENLDLARKASPLSYISAGDPPVLILHGDQDGLASVQQVKIWETALQKAGVEVTVDILEGAGHNIPEDYDYTLVKDFFKKTLGNPAKQ